MCPGLPRGGLSRPNDPAMLRRAPASPPGHVTGVQSQVAVFGHIRPPRYRERDKPSPAGALWSHQHKHVGGAYVAGVRRGGEVCHVFHRGTGSGSPVVAAGTPGVVMAARTPRSPTRSTSGSRPSAGTHVAPIASSMSGPGASSGPDLTATRASSAPASGRYQRPPQRSPNANSLISLRLRRSGHGRSRTPTEIWPASAIPSGTPSSSRTCGSAGVSRVVNDAP